MILFIILFFFCARKHNRNRKH